MAIKKSRKIIIFTLIFFVLSGGILAALFYTGTIWFVNPAAMGYSVKGVDVSSYQGAVDWLKIEAQDIRFAYIKSTEGSSMVDSRFSENWTGAKQTGLKVGAYHFFSFESPGGSQADNFIKTVSSHENMLPPALDVEFYKDFKKNPPEKEALQKEIQDFLTAVEARFGVKPIIYTTYDAYENYIEGRFDNYGLWIRDLFKKPTLEGRNWVLWQYCNRGRLSGYSGKEKYIDLNVYNGNPEEFLEFFSNLKK